MTGFVKILSSSLILGVLVWTIEVSCLRCFQCEFCDGQSMDNTTCSDDISHFEKAGSREACTKTVVEFPEGKMIMKGCGRSFTSGCDTITEEGRTETICACHTDFCNSSRVQRSVSVYALTIFAKFVHLLLRWMTAISGIICYFVSQITYASKTQS